ncbi:hypothetical protein [Brachyspira hampsonii]|uniref:hypothetical protein n=1 Tax=Brachyspira hampsonii TaxID=1287055 RepID=UPI0015E6583A|nr:hypothetical protein [Brachyspira hampsonii]
MIINFNCINNKTHIFNITMRAVKKTANLNKAWVGAVISNKAEKKIKAKSSV